MKKYFVSLFCTVLALAVFLGGCGGNGFVRQTETQRVTGFDEKASYYDALAKGDIEVEVETTSLSNDVAFEGEKKLLPNGAADKLEYILANCYPDIFNKYGDSFSRPKITVTIDPGYSRNDANYTVDRTIFLNPNWFFDHPDDYDSILCAIAGTMQAYDEDAPEWIESGIRNYIRDEFSTMYADEKWSLPSAYDGHSYKEGGIYAAAFLKWASKQTETDLVYRLNRALQDGTFDNSFWKNETGMSLEQLWSLYKKT